MILVVLIIGWGPEFVADAVRALRPDLDAAYVPQAFAIGWFAVTLFCSVAAVVLATVHGIFLTRRLLHKDNQRDG